MIQTQLMFVDYNVIIKDYGPGFSSLQHSVSDEKLQEKQLKGGLARQPPALPPRQLGTF